MKAKLLIKAVTAFLMGAAIIGALIFIPAGTLQFPRAWLFTGVLFIPMLFSGAFLLIKNPELLKRRLNMKEGEKEQRGIITVSAGMFIIGFVVSGIVFRYDFYILPMWMSVVASVLFIILYLLYVEVMRENMYLSRTVEVSEGQKVIDTGLYAVVRHPMYSVTIPMFLSMPIILGSGIAFVIFLLYPVIIVKRIKGEEKFLEKNLPGYNEYKEKVRYRLIPYIW